MNAYRKLTLTALITTVLLVLTPNARAQILQEKVHVTFSGPVEVPGEVLPAGTYIFQALENGRLTRILSADETHVYGTLFTIPEERSEALDRAAVLIGESPKGSPEKVEAWFYPGDSIGNEFMYRKTGSNKDLASVMGAGIRETGHVAAVAARDVAVSAEFLAVHAEHAVVNSSMAIAHAAKSLVS